MAISINWGSGVISVPRADMTLIQSNPTEIRQLDLNAFRLTLKDLEDDMEGMSFVDTHKHNTQVSVGGVDLARVVEIINGYTVTFEDGQYAVNLQGANSNVADVVNVNQVSVRSANSAGLVTSQAIEFGEYGGAVTIDTVNGVAGTIYPTGTLRQPVNNVPDAVLIASYYGFSTINFIGDLTLGVGDDVSGYRLVGQSPSKSLLTVLTESLTGGCEIYECVVTGVMDGNSEFRMCVISNVNYINGYVYKCMFNAGTIALGNNAVFFALDCYSGVPGTSTPVIDMGGSGQGMAVRGYNGGISLINKSGPEATSIDLNSGQIKLNSTITNGDIVCRGVGKVIDADTGEPIPTGNYNGAMVYNETANALNNADAVWNALASKYNIDGSTGERLSHTKPMWQLMGLDKDNPVTTTQTSADVDTIHQNITGDGVNTSTITRTT